MKHILKTIKNIHMHMLHFREYQSLYNKYMKFLKFNCFHNSCLKNKCCDILILNRMAYMFFIMM